MKAASEQEIQKLRTGSREWLKQIYRPLAARAGSAPAGEVGQAPAPRDHEISKAKLDYLVWCAEEPFLFVTARDRKHGISSGTGNAYRTELAAEGLLRLHRIRTGRPGGQVLVTEVTEEGYRLLERFQAKVQRPRGRGSFEHKFWQHVIHVWAVNQGYSSMIEQEVAGKAVDVGQVWGAERVAGEVVVEGLEKELKNLEKDLQVGWDRVVLCAVDKSTLDQLRELIVEKLGPELVEGRQRVRFVRLASFLEEKGAVPLQAAVEKRRPESKDEQKS